MYNWKNNRKNRKKKFLYITVRKKGKSLRWIIFKDKNYEFSCTFQLLHFLQFLPFSFSDIKNKIPKKVKELRK